MKSIFILDDDQDLCWVMSELLLSLGASDCICANSVKELKALGTQFKFDVAILDINLGDNEPSGVEAYKWLIQNKFQGKIVFFSGHAKLHPLVQNAIKFPNVSFMEKPSPIENLKALIT